MESFKEGAGLGAAELYLLIAGLGCVAILLCAAWILVSGFRGFARGTVDGDIYGIVVWRVVLLIVLFLWLFL